MNILGWNVNPQGAGYFQRQWVDFVDPTEVPRRLKTIRCWDLAGSVASELNADPDSTAGVKISLCEDGYFYVESAKEVIARPAGVEKLINDTAMMDGKNCPIGIPKDSASGGIVQFQHYARPLILAGYKVKQMKSGNRGKLERFTPFSNAAENGLVRIVRGSWNEKYLKQLEDFDPERRRQHDDYVDSTADSYNWLVSGKKLPDKFKFNSSSLTQVNTFANF